MVRIKNLSYSRLSLDLNLNRKNLKPEYSAGADPGFFLGGGAPVRNDVTDGEVKKI